MEDQAAMAVLAQMTAALGCGPVEATDWHSPLAVICPTTPKTREVSVELQRHGAVSVVGEGKQGEDRTTHAVLKSLAAGRRVGLVVFSDQLVGPSDASVLVHTNEQTAYMSAFEAVLHLKYGYRLAIWTVDGFRLLEAHVGNLEMVFRCMTTYLRDCSTLGDAWLARELQLLRTPAERTAAALRKTRVFKSSVMDAFMRSHDDLEAVSLLGAIAELERRVAAVAA